MYVNISRGLQSVNRLRSKNQNSFSDYTVSGCSERKLVKKYSENISWTLLWKC